MNILPKKRWHVRTKDNVARVRRDEAKAAEEERVRVQRQELAEQEFRTGQLRQKAAARRQFDFPTDVESTADAPLHDPSGHVNFFADIEQQQRTFGANKEHEEEKRRLKEEEEKKIGLLKYLGEGSSEYMKTLPWYQTAPRRNDANVTGDVGKKEEKSCLVMKRKTIKIDTEKQRRSQSQSSKEKSGKKKKKHRKKSKAQSREEESDSDSLERLRADRLRREKAERLRAEQLLRGPPATTAVNTVPQVQQQYSSQFNPDLARQNRPRN